MNSMVVLSVEVVPWSGKEDFQERSLAGVVACFGPLYCLIQGHGYCSYSV